MWSWDGVRVGDACVELALDTGTITAGEQSRPVSEFELDLTRPASELVRVVRAGNPRPGAWLALGDARLKVWRAHQEDGRLVPDEVQPPGKRTMTYAAWQAGHRGSDPFA